MKLDTLYISELSTEKPIVKIYNNTETKTVKLAHPTIASIHSKDDKHTYLTILAPNKNLTVSVLPDSSITTNNKSDSLLNYLQKGSLKFYKDNSKFIFNTQNLDSVPILLEKFTTQREKEINQFEDQFSPEIADILHYQNTAYIYSFLFWLGRLEKRLPPTDPYFKFADKIPEADKTLKGLPDIYLYKYEIEYFKQNQSIESIPDFLKFIEERTKNKDLADYLKAKYIKLLIELPFYLKEHEKLLNPEVLTQLVTSEKANGYFDLIEKPVAAFYASQNGETAYAFQAEDRYGDSFTLESLKGKVVFIDTWATWCAPCIHHRPKILELAEKYQNNDEVEIILVSVDSSKDKWLSYLDEEDSKFGKNVFIKNGMETKFGDRYNIKSIPRYILIGKNGKIITSTNSEPSLTTENKIEDALKET